MFILIIIIYILIAEFERAIKRQSVSETRMWPILKLIT